jgi:hypothetical protein
MRLASFAGERHLPAEQVVAQGIVAIIAGRLPLARAQVRGERGQRRGVGDRPHGDGMGDGDAQR